MIDNELVCGTEDYESVQEYYERRRHLYCPSETGNNSERLHLEYFPEIIKMEDENEKKDTIDNKQRALGRIYDILQAIPSNS